MKTEKLYSLLAKMVSDMDYGMQIGLINLGSRVGFVRDLQEVQCSPLNLRTIFSLVRKRETVAQVDIRQ